MTRLALTMLLALAAGCCHLDHEALALALEGEARNLDVSDVTTASKTPAAYDAQAAASADLLLRVAKALRYETEAPK